MSRPIIGYVVEAATKLFKSRKIGGVDFDGTQNIDLPGVNKTGNQNTTGNAASATKLAVARSFAIKGDGTATPVNFNGENNVSLNFTLANLITAEQVGNKSTIPVLNINAKGQVIGIGKAEIGKTIYTLVNETTTIASGASKDYNLATIAGSSLSDYDLTGVRVVALIKDTNASSPTHNYFINSEAFLTVGVSANNQSVRIHNSREYSAETKIVVTVPGI